MGEFLQSGLVQSLLYFGLVDYSQNSKRAASDELNDPMFFNAFHMSLCKMQTDDTLAIKPKDNIERRPLPRRRILKRSISLASSSGPQSDCSSSSDEYSAPSISKNNKHLSPKRENARTALALKLPNSANPSKPNQSSSMCSDFHRSYSYPSFNNKDVKSPADTVIPNMAFSSLHNEQTHDSKASKSGNPNFALKLPVSRSMEVSTEETKDPVSTVAAPRKMGHARSRSDVPRGVHFATNVDVPQPCSAGATIPRDHDLYSRRRSFLEDGGSVAANTECFFPIPQKGQSLTSFLSSDDFQTCPELDRENAHFYISEALISAIEQIKCNQLLQKVEEECDESDEEIQHLKQRIRIRRRERQQERVTQKGPLLLSDGKTDTTTSQSASSPMSSTYTEGSEFSSCSSEDDVDELELSDTNTSNLSSIQEKGLSLSLASLYSDADIKRVNQLKSAPCSPRENTNLTSWEMSRENLTAEAVALSLLKKFSEKQLPKASDLEWLVSEQDAPQRLLPLPDSWPVSPDDVEEQISLQRTRLRGTLDWAPPRAQIIFIVHPNPNRKMQVAKQQYRCSGCGMRIERDYIHRFRYCKYLGKYFCQCCHNNSMAFIPGHVLQKWDFSKYYVSNFSRDLLERMDSDPLFNILDVNPALYKKSRSLETVRACRLQLSHLVEYISTCKDAQRLKKELENLPDHWFREPHVYSLQDLVLVKKSCLGDMLQKLSQSCIHHVLHCPLCQGKGFICEVCRDTKSIIFPFQLTKVIQCKGCGSCFHKTCFDPSKCPKCARIELRKKKLAEEQSLSSEEDL